MITVHRYISRVHPQWRHRHSHRAYGMQRYGCKNRHFTDRGMRVAA